MEFNPFAILIISGRDVWEFIGSFSCCQNWPVRNQNQRPPWSCLDGLEVHQTCTKAFPSHPLRVRYASLWCMTCKNAVLHTERQQAQPGRTKYGPMRQNHQLEGTIQDTRMEQLQGPFPGFNFFQAEACHCRSLARRNGSNMIQLALMNIHKESYEFMVPMKRRGVNNLGG